ncbi:MAG: hypothetical protein K6U11_09585 [bacterium]|nr:hypothetical protein [bacterium]
MALVAVRKLSAVHFSKWLIILWFSFFILMSGSLYSYAFYNLPGWGGYPAALPFGPLSLVGGLLPYYYAPAGYHAPAGVFGSPLYGPAALAGLSGFDGLGPLGILLSFGGPPWGYSPYGLYRPGASLASVLALGALAGLWNSQWLNPPSVSNVSPSAEPVIEPAIIKQSGKRVLKSFAVAEQAGLWEGTWFSLIKASSAGKMSLDLVENPISHELSGTCTMLLNKYITGSVDVSGTFDPAAATFTLSGTYTDLALREWSLKLDCTLADSQTVSGKYIIYDQLYTRGDYGKFDLSLTAAAPVIPAPGQSISVPSALTSPLPAVPTATTPAPAIPTTPTLPLTPALVSPVPLAPAPAITPLFIPGIFAPLPPILPPI